MEHITEGAVDCLEPNPDHATFRAKLYGTETASTSHLISYIMQWIESGPTFVLQGIRVSIDPTCPVAIESFTDPGCRLATAGKPTSTSSSGVDTGAIAGAVAAGFIALLIVAAWIVYLVLKHRKAKHKISE